MSLFITYVSLTYFGPHRSIIRSVLQAVFAVLVCGNTRTTRHVQPLGICRKFFLQLHNGWTCWVVCILPHTKTANTACKTLLMMDRWGLKHVQLTYVMNKLTKKTLCILLDCIYITRWYTVPTISGCNTLLFVVNCAAYPDDTSFLKNAKLVHYPPSFTCMIPYVETGYG